MCEESKGYPIAFVSIIWDTGHTTLSQWLEANAPKDVQELHEAMGVLAVNMFGKHDLEDNEHVQEAVLNVAQGVTALGGHWHSPMGIV